MKIFFSNDLGIVLVLLVFSLVTCGCVNKPREQPSTRAEISHADKIQAEAPETNMGIATELHYSRSVADMQKIGRLLAARITADDGITIEYALRNREVLFKVDPKLYWFFFSPLSEREAREVERWAHHFAWRNHVKKNPLKF